MHRAAIALLILAGCSELAQKQLPTPPLPADIAMRLGGSLESIELAFRAYKVTWMGESSDADVVVGVIGRPGRRHLWTVVGFRERRPDGSPTIRVIDGNDGVFETEVAERHLSACPGVELPFQEDGTARVEANDSKKTTHREKTTVIPDPEYVLITRSGEYHFRQRQDPSTAAQIDELLVAVDDCAAR